jgi:hypothetical protein
LVFWFVALLWFLAAFQFVKRLLLCMVPCRVLLEIWNTHLISLLFHAPNRSQI